MDMLKFIEEEFQLRCYDRFQIFLNVCPKMNYELPEEIKVANWIHNIKYFQSQRASNVLSSTFPVHYYDLLSTICNIYTKHINKLIDSEFQTYYYDRTHVFLFVCQKLGLNGDFPDEATLRKQFQTMRVEMLDNLYRTVTTLQQVKPYQHLFNIVNERFWYNITQLIKECFQQRKSETQTFFYITQLLNYNQLELEVVEQMFEDYKINRLNHERTFYEHRRLVEKIAQDFLMYRNAVFSDRINGGQLLGDSKRYQCKYYKNLVNEEQQIKLTDLFHDETRTFLDSDSLNNSESSTSSNQSANFYFFARSNFPPTRKIQKGHKFVQLHSNRLLFLSDNGQFAFISLAELDFENSTFKLLDRRKIHELMHTIRVIFDTMDKRKFAILLENHTDTRVFYGHIKDQKQIIISDGFQKFQQTHCCFDLEADKTIGLLAGYDDLNIIERVWFWEQPAEAQNSSTPSIKFEFEFVDYCNEGQTVSLQDYAWAGDVCYTVSNIHSIHAFNINTKKCTEIHFTAIGYTRSPIVERMNCLFLRNNTHIYKFAMRKPDTFLNIVWSEVRRQKMFFNKRVYENALKVGPLQLQPFYV